MQQTFSEKFKSASFDYLTDMKNRYKEVFKLNIEGTAFRIEEELYKFIIKNFKDFWNTKIQLAEDIRKNHFKLWEIAFRHKCMQDSKIAEYTKEEQVILKQFYSEYLGAYYSLKIFADSRFARDNILKYPQPDNFAFALFRFEYPDNRQLILIIDDLISYLATSDEQNHIGVSNAINYALFENTLTKAEILLAEKLFTRKPLKNIAKELNKSESTLKTQRNAIYSKLEVESQEEFIEKITLKG